MTHCADCLILISQFDGDSLQNMHAYKASMFSPKTYIFSLAVKLMVGDTADEASVFHVLLSFPL